MNLLAAIPGILLPAAIGWCAVGLAEYRTSILTRMERVSWSLILGPTLSMLTVFTLEALGVSDFSLLGFLIPMALLLLILTLLGWKFGCLIPKNEMLPLQSEPRGWLRIAILLFALWTAVKIIAGAYDLFSVPTYWDDSFNNWNMRGKIFYETKMLALEIPVGNGVVQTAQGVSSYPPSLPLMKTWVSSLRGSWQEPLVNGIQLLWFGGLLLGFFATLRRRMGRLRSLFGTSLLCSLPLLLIHAVNPYAEIFLASHLLLTVSAVFHLAESQDREKIWGWLRLFALSLGLLVFTKNEAMVVYAPIALLLAGLCLFKFWKGNVIRTPVLKHALTALLILGGLMLPWLLFKWTHGLTFGNAKAVSGIELRFSGKALWAIWHHLSHEPNEMLLPLLLPLTLIASGKRCLRLPEGILTAFLLGAIGLQMFVFIFVPALETEAIMQTGISRGLIQVSPIAMLLMIFLGSKLWNTEQD